jgi:outer membrane receptor protein involved in Fe transport
MILTVVYLPVVFSPPAVLDILTFCVPSGVPEATVMEKPSSTPAAIVTSVGKVWVTPPMTIEAMVLAIQSTDVIFSDPPRATSVLSRDIEPYESNVGAVPAASVRPSPP